MVAGQSVCGRKGDSKKEQGFREWPEEKQRVGTDSGAVLLLVGSWRRRDGAQKPEDIPDAPSARGPCRRPRHPAPARGRSGRPPDTADRSPVRTSSQDTCPPQRTPDAPTTATSPAPPPMPPIKTVPAGSVPRDWRPADGSLQHSGQPQPGAGSGYGEGQRGRLVSGLQPKDFSVLENGQAAEAEVLHQ